MTGAAAPGGASCAADHYASFLPDRQRFRPQRVKKTFLPRRAPRGALRRVAIIIPVASSTILSQES